MKKLVLFVALSLVATSYVSAQYYFDFGMSSDGVINVTAETNAYVIEFNLDINSITETPHFVDDNYYNTLDLPYSFMYDYVDSIGMPMLPVRHVDLQVPNNFTDSLYISDSTFVYEYIDIKNPYYPFQEIWGEDSSVHFYMNEIAYNSLPDWTRNNEVGISSFQYYFDRKGFRLSIHPFSYDPIHQKVRVIRYMSIRIPIIVDCIIDQFTFHSIKTYIDYVRDLEIHPSGNVAKRILMVTPESLTETLEPYIEYREAQHHQVSLITLEQIALYNHVSVNEITSSMIINRLQYYYDSYWPRPQYVILVGDNYIIPYASGSVSNYNNPASDFDYSLPTLNTDSKTLRMRMSVGRWPVSTVPYRVKRIIDNIIKFETMIDDSIGVSTLPVDVVSGIDGNGYSDDFFDAAYNVSQMLNSYDVQLYDGRAYLYPNSYLLNNAVINDINNDLWMLIYNGHGCSTGFGEPLAIGAGYLSYFENILPLMVFSFACSTNAGQFGREWVSDYWGLYNNAISFFGPTTDEGINIANNYMYNIFRNFTHYHLGDNLLAGAQKTYADHSSYTDINTIKRFLFLGDPVLHIYGATYFGERLQFVSPRQYENTDENHINYHENSMSDAINKTRVYNISGQLIMQFDTSVTIETIKSLMPSGIYFVEKNNGIERIAEKIFIF